MFSVSSLYDIVIMSPVMQVTDIWSFSTKYFPIADNAKKE